MPRPRPDYARPEHTACAWCGGPVAVPLRGRIPDAHPQCGDLRRAITRAVVALEGATVGASPAQLRQLRRLWAELQASGNLVWNRVDNPARRR